MAAPGVIVYRSTDTSAPTLNGTTDTSFIDLLQAALVTGYGSKVPAGWTRPFYDAAAKQATFRQGGGHKRDYRMWDGQHSASFGDFTFVTGYERMSSVSVGIQSFPADVDRCIFTRATPQNNPGPLAWIIVADKRTAYIFSEFETGVSPKHWRGMMMGDFFSYKANDAYRAGLATNVNDVSSQGKEALLQSTTHVADGGGIDLVTIARSYTGVVGAKTSSTSLGGSAISHYGDVSRQGGVLSALHGIVAAPNGGSTGAGFFIAEVHIGETAAPSPRGKHRGLWHFCHAPASVNHGDQIIGAGDFLGRTFEIIKPLGLSANFTSEVACIEISDTWDTNGDPAAAKVC